jgi:hypothetical protein
MNCTPSNTKEKTLQHIEGTNVEEQKELAKGSNRKSFARKKSHVSKSQLNRKSAEGNDLWTIWIYCIVNSVYCCICCGSDSS